MTAASCEAVAAALPAAASELAPMRYLSFEPATEGWALETCGLVRSEGRLGSPAIECAPASTPTQPLSRHLGALLTESAAASSLAI